MRTDPDAIRLLTDIRSLRGCPATIVLALALMGPMTNYDLQLATGYTDKPITKALQLLEMKAMCHHIGRQSGWTLSDGMKQLPLYPSHLLSAEPPRSEIFRSTPLTTTTIRSSISNGKKEEVSTAIPDRKNSDLDDPDHAPLVALLVGAGIGRKSQKLREILATAPTLDYLTDHVNYYRWWQKERDRQPNSIKEIDGWKRYSIGMMITRIIDRDPAPETACPDCGRKDCLCSIIVR